MSGVYDNWGRLVAAVIKKQQLWELCHQHSRTPSTCSEASESSFEVPFGDEGSVHISPRIFTFRELAAATENFRPELILREGGFGVLYKGRLEGTKQAVSIISHGNEGNHRFLTEVLILSSLHHPNMVDLIGYCADADHRLLVHEYMPYGSLHDHLHDLKPEKTPLDWNTRMKIAAGVAKCLEYMHDMANPPVIHRNVKSLNVLLGEGYHPKLSNFGLAKLGPTGGKTHVSTRLRGTFGYCAPEYARTGLLTVKADVYSYGVVLLEIITGREVTDISRAIEETNLVDRIQLLYQDRGKLMQVADPMLQGRFPIRSLYQALDIAATCLRTDPDDRPSMTNVATSVNNI